MVPLPEWPSNVHSFIIHFPFALLTTAVLIDLASLFTTRWIGVRITAVALFTLGALGTLVAFFTGQTAAEAVKLPLAAVATLNDHADWAELTFWFFGLYAIVRLVGLWVDHKSRDWARHWVHVLFFLVGASGLSLLVTTEILGNRLVYKYGVGVQAIPYL